MRISKVQNNPNITTSNYNRPLQKFQFDNPPKDSVSFQGSSFYLTYIIARNGIGALQSGIKSRKIYKFKMEIQNAMNNIEKNKGSLSHIITALSKTPSSLDNSLIYEILTMAGNDNYTIAGLKQLALTKLFPATDDNLVNNIVAKKELMNSLYNSGEYLNNEFIDTFKTLPDNHYKHYKKDFIEKILYSDFAYKPSKKPEQYVYNLRLVETLDKNIYKEFLESHVNKVNELKKTILKISAKRMLKEKNASYLLYNYDFNYPLKMSQYEEPALWKESSEKIFYAIIQTYGDKPKEIAKKLNIDEECVNEILKDMNALYLAENTSDKKNQLAVLQKRINEKFESPKIIGKLDKNVSNRIRDEYEELENLENKKAGIESFIKRTDYEPELLKIFKQKLNTLDAEIKNAGDNYSKKYDREFWSGMP